MVEKLAEKLNLIIVLYFSKNISIKEVYSKQELNFTKEFEVWIWRLKIMK
jgi:hypothetical protein